jgi:hypothetical protein
VVRGEDVECRRGGKEVHAADVARAVSLLLVADDIAGQAFNCYDRYVSEYEVATITRQVAGTQGQIRGESRQPKHQIETGKLRGAGMTFGGDVLLHETIEQLVDQIRRSIAGKP